MHEKASRLYENAANKFMGCRRYPEEEYKDAIIRAYKNFKLAGDNAYLAPGLKEISIEYLEKAAQTALSCNDSNTAIEYYTGCIRVARELGKNDEIIKIYENIADIHFSRSSKHPRYDDEDYRRHYRGMDWFEELTKALAKDSTEIDRFSIEAYKRCEADYFFAIQNLEAAAKIAEKEGQTGRAMGLYEKTADISNKIFRSIAEITSSLYKKAGHGRSMPMKSLLL